MKGKKTGSTGKRVLMLLLVAVLAVLSLRCSLDNPGMPSWDVRFAIPFSSQRYGLDSLVTPLVQVIDPVTHDTSWVPDSARISIGGDGFLEFQFDDDLGEFDLDSTLFEMDLHDSTSFPVPLGVFRVEGSDAYISVGMAELIDGFVDGGTYDLGGVPIPPETLLVHAFDNLEEAHLLDPDGGTMEIGLHNDSPITWDSVRVDVELADAGYPELGSVVLRNVGQNDNVAESFSIDGKTLRQNLNFTITLYPNPDQGSVVLHEADGLDFSTLVSDLNCVYLKGPFTRQDPINVDTTIVLEDEDNWLLQARVTRGTIRVIIDNGSQTEDSVYVSIPGIVPYVDSQEDSVNFGDPLTLGFLIASSLGNSPRPQIDTTLMFGTGYGSGNLDSDFMLNMNLPPGYNTANPGDQSMDLLSTVVPLGLVENGEIQTIRVWSDDIVRLTVVLEELELEWLSGFNKSDSLEIDPVEEVIDIWEGQESLQSDLARNMFLANAVLLLDLTGSSYEAPAKVLLNVTSINSSAELETTAEILRYIATGETQVEIGGENDPGNEGVVVELINNFPDIIRVEGSVYFGREQLPPGEVINPDDPFVLARTDKFVGSLNFTAPLKFIIEDTTTLRGAVEKMDSGLGSGIKRITLASKILNRIPLGGSLYMLAGQFDNEDQADESLVLENIAEYKLLAEPLRIELPPLNADGRVDTSAVSDTLITVTLDENGIDILSQDNVYVRQVVVLEPTGQVVGAHVDDYLEVSVTAEAELRVNDPGEE